jgi:hypothetical protein
VNGFRLVSLCAALALVALLFATGSATAGTADHHPAGPAHAASDTDAAPAAPSHQADTGPGHCPSDHPMSFKIMTCCMAMVPDQVVALYRHIAITVHPSHRVVAHDRTIRPPLKPPEPSV